MRFLYGDSAPFPLGYDFLATLDAFMAAATRIVRLEFASRDAALGVDEAARLRGIGQSELDRFHDVVTMSIQVASNEMRHPSAVEFSRQLSHWASSYADAERQRMTTANDQDLARIRADSEGRIHEQRAALAQFLKAVRLPVLATNMSATLVVQGKEAHHEVSAQFDHPDGLYSAFSLVPSRLESWNQPRLVRDFAEGTELMVGVEKSWLRGTVTPKQVLVDDWIVTEFAFSDDVFEITLKKRVADHESLSFRVERGDAGLIGKVSSTGDASSALDGPLTPHDLASLERVWRAIAVSAQELANHKGDLLEVSLDGQAVFEHRLVLPFVARLITTFAPTVHEIALRSPSSQELSLKRETEAGRREEIYLRKDELLGKLQPLTAEGRRIFAPLGLDSWVPSMTAEPPAVSARAPMLTPTVSGGSVPPGSVSARSVPLVPLDVAVTTDVPISKAPAPFPDPTPPE